MKSQITMNLSLFVDCPHCDEQIDLTSQTYNDESQITRHIFSDGLWQKALDGEFVECEHCGKNIELGEIEY